MHSMLVLLIPFLYGLANLGDKYVVAKKVASTESYVVLIGGIHLGIGISLALLLDWSNGIHLRDALTAVPCGVFYGAQLYLYYVLFSLEDASNIVSLEFAYPVVVAALAYVFLNERVPLGGYVAMALIVGGLLSLTVRMAELRLAARPWMIGALILCNGLNEFFIKLATGRLPGAHGFAIESVVAGALVCGFLLKRSVRAGVMRELPNVRYAIGIEALTLSSILCKFFAMTALPAIYVSSVAALQPLVVLSGERLSFNSDALVKDRALAPKLAGISVVVVGLALLVWSMGAS
jgi:drug/metabolite transporter (DMT)-like permease